MDLAAFGYHISLRDSLLTLRSAYSSPYSYFTKVYIDDTVCKINKHLSFTCSVDAEFGCFCFSKDKDVDVEVVRATILFQLHDNFLAIDSTVACTLS